MMLEEPEVSQYEEMLMINVTMDTKRTNNGIFRLFRSILDISGEDVEVTSTSPVNKGAEGDVSSFTGSCSFVE
ncbi:MAG TPA: hypothetical protein ENH18_00990, partial [Nitrospirae bacterium]|nr:hypothetical protein [Nitrospirota bacterium]HEW80922.1 hypothetical protein [Nitrospirota bacterium]